MKLLNEASCISRALHNVELAERLASHLDELHSLCDGGNGVFLYDRAAISRPFRELMRVARALATFDLARLAGESARRAFWLNVYSLLTVHAVVDLRVRKSVREVRGFYDCAYVIGGHPFTLDDIEHGVLRGNTAKYGGLSSPWKSGDPRVHQALPVWAEVHFGLYAATRSSPPLRVFCAADVDEALTTAAREFLRREVTVDWGRRRLLLPKVFRWYEPDFGGREGVLRFVAARHEEPRVGELLQSRPPPEVKFASYDWGLNGPNISGPLPLV